MKKTILYIGLISSLFFTVGCKKFLDVNKDPNNPLDVQESLLLSPIETSIATNIAGGSFSTLNYNGVGLITSYWTQQLALNQSQPQVDGYKMFQDADVEQIWLYLYTAVLKNSNILNSKAETNKNYSYAAISKILTAYTLGVATDMYGDIPYSQAFQGSVNLKPAYDSQEKIYTDIQGLLDSAIAEIGLAPGKSQPSSDDFIYGGDMTKWMKLAYTLKARNYMHLSKAPGYTASTQAGLALTALANGFTSSADDATFTAYNGNSGGENPWYVNTTPDQGGVVIASTLFNALKTRNDPRMSIMITGTDSGRVIGTDPVSDYTVYSQIGSYYSAATAALSIVNYSEAMFLKAEATLVQSGAAAAEPFYESAINAHMTRLGVTSTDAATYISTRNLTSSNALQYISQEHLL